MGLNSEFGEHSSREKIEQDSKKHPEHMFKIGYFRSSYNGGGINSVLDSLGFGGLYWIFDNKDQYEFAPDWEKSLKRVREVLDKFREFTDSDIGKYRVATCDSVDGEQYQWYIDALEVVEETILYVLKQDDSDDYYFHWSG